MMKARKRDTSATRYLRIAAISFIACMALLGWAASAIPGSTTGASVTLMTDERSEAVFGPDLSPEEQQIDYSRFLHSNPSHSRLPCLLCHRREDNSARMKFPGKPNHLPCAGCHTAQFQDTGNAMCNICHSNRETGALRNFPPLRSFRVRFDHGKHLRQTNCATCHTPTRRGVALSMPRGTSAHVTCFQCHTANNPIGACNVCHQPGRPIRASESARAFAVNFSHLEHRSRGNLNCSSCHTVFAGAARGRQVSAPAARMHFPTGRGQSCASCHNGKRAFGADDFSNCRRCHEGSSFRF